MELTQSVQTLGPGSRVPSGPSGIPWFSESPGSKGADQALKELTTHSPGHCGPRAHGAPAGRAWAQGFLRMLEEWSQSDSRYLRWAGLPPPHPAATTRAQRAPGSTVPRPRARLPRADNLARGPDVRAHARPRYQNISAARIRPARGAPSPLPAASSLKAPRSRLVRPRTGSEIPVTGLAFHLRNRDLGDSRASEGSLGLGQTQSARPTVCHSLSPVASLTNNHGGWRHNDQFSASEVGLKAQGGS